MKLSQVRKEHLKDYEYVEYILTDSTFFIYNTQTVDHDLTWC